MKSYGFHQLGLDAIEYDEQDIAERQKTQRVVDLAASRKAIAINPVTVAAGKLVAGRDRLAADLLNGVRAPWCHVVTECSKADLLRIEVEENVRRRDIDRDVQLARLVELTEAAAPVVSGQAARKPGRPQTAKGSARAEVAKVAGTTPEAVRRAETRAAAKAEPSKDVVPAPPIHTFGLPLSDELRADVEHVLEHAGAAAQALQRALGALTQASEALDALNAAENYAASLPWCKDVKRLHDQVRTLGADVRAYLPKSECAYCKGDGHVPVGGLQRCTACRGAGWVGADASKAPIPAELLREGADAMVSDGRGGFAKFAEAPGGATESAKGRRRDEPSEAKGVATPGGGKRAAEDARLASPSNAPHTNQGETNERGDGHRRRGKGDEGGQAGGARRLERQGDVAGVPEGVPAGHPDQRQHGGGDGAARGHGVQVPAVPHDADGGRGVRAVAGEPDGHPGGGLDRRRVAATAGASSKRPRTMLVEVGGRMVDALNPPDDLTYSGDDAPPADLPELVIEPDEAVAMDDDGELF